MNRVENGIFSISTKFEINIDPFPNNVTRPKRIPKRLVAFSFRFSSFSPMASSKRDSVDTEQSDEQLSVRSFVRWELFEKPSVGFRSTISKSSRWVSKSWTSYWNRWSPMKQPVSSVDAASWKTKAMPPAVDIDRRPSWTIFPSNEVNWSNRFAVVLVTSSTADLCVHVD